MLRFALFAGIATSAMYLASASSAAPQGPVVIFPQDEIINEPVLVFSLTGGTLTGTLHTQLAVYNSGFATLAEKNDTVFPAPGEFIDVQTTYLDQRDIRKLRGELKAAGSFNLGDQQLVLADIPLSTITVLEGQMANTFSYWTSSGAYSAPAGVIGDFIATHFPVD